MLLFRGCTSSVFSTAFRSFSLVIDDCVFIYPELGDDKYVFVESTVYKLEPVYKKCILEIFSKKKKLKYRHCNVILSNSPIWVNVSTYCHKICLDCDIRLLSPDLQVLDGNCVKKLRRFRRLQLRYRHWEILIWTPFLATAIWPRRPSRLVRAPNLKISYLWAF